MGHSPTYVQQAIGWTRRHAVLALPRVGSPPSIAQGRREGGQKRRNAAGMAGSGLEVADIFRDHGPAWRKANRGHISLEQLKVMSAIERCRTAALGGHVARS